MRSTRKWFVAVIVLCALAAPALAQGNDWRVVPGRRAGPIGPRTTEAALIRTFGRQNVMHVQVQIADLPAFRATAVYPHDALRKIVVIWKSGRFGQVPDMALIEGPRTFWTLPERITIGTTLATLQKLNGRPCAVNGFEWDNGGAVSWRGGRLETVLRGASLTVTEGNWSALTDDERMAVSGEKQLMSDLPAVQKLAPYVGRIFVTLRLPTSHH